MGDAPTGISLARRFGHAPKLAACAVAALLAASGSTPARSARPAGPGAVRHAATFLTMMGGDTLSIERVRDVAGGYLGEIAVPSGATWIHYRVWVGPGETVTRIDIAMTSMVASEPGESPRPFLEARRGRDSVVIRPAEGMTGLPEHRVAVPATALLSMGCATASDEQAVRRALSLGGRVVRFPIVEPMNGQVWDATLTCVGRDTMVFVAGHEEWRFAVDAEGRIQGGRHLWGEGLHPALIHGMDKAPLEIRRVDPRAPLPVNRSLTLPDSAQQVVIDERRAGWERLQADEAEFRRLLESGPPPEELAPSIDRFIARFAERGGSFQAEKCLEAVASLSRTPAGLPSAEHYAHRAVAHADGHEVRLYGDDRWLAIRATARKALAEVQFTVGKQDSALLSLRGALEILPESDELALHRDMCITLGALLEAQGRDDEAIATLFEAVALDPNPDSLAAAPPLRGIWTRRFPGSSDLDGRMRMAAGRKWYRGAGQGEQKPWDAPPWSLPDLSGRVTRSRRVAGKPVVLVFWGGWSEAGRAAARLADAWHRHRRSLGVEVISINCELPGPGPLSAALAGTQVTQQNLGVPVLLDHNQEVFRSFRADTYPYAVLIDRRGRVRYTAFGDPQLWSVRIAAEVDSLRKPDRP